MPQKRWPTGLPPALPLIVATPVLGLLLNLDATATSAVALTLLVGTPALTFTGMIGAALAVTLHRGGLLLAVLVLPLSIPVLIFGVAASQAAIYGPAVIWNTVFDPVRAVAGQPRRRTVRGRGKPAPRSGLNDDLTPINSRGGHMKQTKPHCLPRR